MSSRPMNAMLTGWSSPLTAVRTPRSRTSISGPATWAGALGARAAATAVTTASVTAILNLMCLLRPVPPGVRQCEAERLAPRAVGRQ